MTLNILSITGTVLLVSGFFMLIFFFSDKAVIFFSKDYVEDNKKEKSILLILGCFVLITGVFAFKYAEHQKESINNEAWYPETETEIQAVKNNITVVLSEDERHCTVKRVDKSYMYTVKDKIGINAYSNSKCMIQKNFDVFIENIDNLTYK